MTDKSRWVKVKLGDIATEISNRVDNPKESFFDRFVGLEHFVSGELVIRNWGSTLDLISSMKEFKSNDVLLARRNVYLKRASLVTFDGLCSGDAIVLREKPSMIANKFLPFILNTENFWGFANANADGSMSKRINVKTLMQYEFLLPPVEEQERIAEVLWAADEVIVKYRNVLSSIQVAKNCLVDEWLATRLNKTVPFSELWTKSPESGCSAPEPAQETGKYVLSLSALSKNGYAPGNMKRAPVSLQMGKAQLSNGDLLISRSNTAELVGFVGIYNDDDKNVSFPDTMMRLCIDKSKVGDEYIQTILLSSYGRAYMKKICAGTSSSMKKINRKTLGSIRIPFVDASEQKQLVNKDSYFQTSAEHCINAVTKMCELLNQYLNRLLGGAN